MKAAVLGGGIAGLAAGLALTRAGWQVTVLERAARLEAVGAALSIWPNAVGGLNVLGVLDSVRRCAAPLKAVLVADRDSRPVIRVRSVDGLALMITRADLQKALADALPPGVLALDHEVTGITASGGTMRLRFANGGEQQADVIVDAGGLRSIAADRDTISYRGYGGVVALSDPVDDGGLDGLAAEYWGWHERFGIFELPASRRYWFYMRDQPATAAAPSLDLVSSRAINFPPSIGRAIAATPADRLIPFAIYARAAPRRLGHGRVIRVGDAAHAMEPNLGQGTCQAIEDAVALGVAASSGSVEDVLATYERLRLKRVAMIVRRAAEGRYGAHGPLTTQWLARSLFRLLPAGVSDNLTRSIQTLPPYGD